MAKNIPFFDMFAELQHVPALRLKLAGAELTGASIDQAAMSIKLQLLTRQELTAADVQAVREAICGVYGFESVEINQTCLAPQPKAAPAEAPAGDKGGKSAGKVILGNQIKIFYNVQKRNK